jgi:hypothetical protein
MGRQPTMSINASGLSMSKVVPVTLGDRLSFVIDKDRGEIHVMKEPGEHMAMVTYPEMIPIIKSMPLIRWIKKELGNRNFSRMPVEWNEEESKFIVKPGVKV